MCTPYVTTQNNLHAARSIENAYPPLPDDDPDSGIVAVARETSSKVSGSRPSVRSAPFGATYTSYHSARHCFPPITPANAQPTPSPALASARQRSRVSARAVVRAAGDPCAGVGANAMYGGGAAARGRGGDVPCQWVAIGAAPSVVCAECGNDGWTEETYGRAGVRREKEGYEGFLGEVGTKVVAGIEHAYQALLCRHGGLW